MNQKTQIEVLKKELNSLENLVGTFQRKTTFHPNDCGIHPNPSQVFKFHTNLRTQLQYSKSKIVRNEYKNTFNLKLPTNYQIQNEFKCDKYKFVGKKSENFFSNTSGLKHNMMKKPFKCGDFNKTKNELLYNVKEKSNKLNLTNKLITVNQSNASNNLKSTMSSHFEKISSLSNILDKINNPLNKDSLNATQNCDLNVPSYTIATNLSQDYTSPILTTGSKISNFENFSQPLCSLDMTSGNVSLPISGKNLLSNNRNTLLLSKENCVISNISGKTKQFNDGLQISSKNLKNLNSPSTILSFIKAGKSNVTDVSPKHAVLSTYKLISKNPTILQKKLSMNQNELQTSLFIKTPSKGKVFIAYPKNDVNSKKRQISKELLCSAKITTVRAKSLNRFKFVNKNSRTLKEINYVIKCSTSQNLNLKKKAMLLSKNNKLSINKYKVKNNNKISNGSKYKVISSNRNNLCSKYKVINEYSSKNSVNSNLKQNKIEAKEISIPDLSNGSCDNGLKNENSQKITSDITSQTLNKKINQLKFKHSSYEEFDLLTDFSPDELVAMDTQSLLKLSALLKSSNNKHRVLIKKSRYKLISKQPSLLNQTAKMIKTKYQTKNKRMWKKQGRCISNSYKGVPIKFASTWYKKGLHKHDYNVQKKSFLKLKNARYRKVNGVVHSNIYHMSKTRPRNFRKSSMRFNGRALLRKSNFGITWSYKGTGSPVFKPHLQSLASRVLHKSIQTACLSAAKKKQMKKMNIYCMFFNRFAKCNRGTSCPYIHDPSKIAVCTRFLRGTCKVENCLFSHEISPGKMAICSYFLQGLCTKKDCPYRHKELDPQAKLCKEFVQGYCSLGIKCEKAHILICPKHLRGECEKGKFCAYPHPPKREKNCTNKENDIISEDEGSKTSTLHRQKLLEQDEDSDEEILRYFVSVGMASKSQNMKETLESVEISEFNSVSCQPRRDQSVNCPVFIPL